MPYDYKLRMSLRGVYLDILRGTDVAQAVQSDYESDKRIEGEVYCFIV